MNKASSGDGIPVEVFQIPKDDVVKVPHYMPANFEKSAVTTGPEKVSFHSNPKNAQTTAQLHSSHTLVMATHSSVLAWRIPGTAEPGGLPSMGSHRVGHD